MACETLVHFFNCFSFVGAIAGLRLREASVMVGAVRIEDVRPRLLILVIEKRWDDALNEHVSYLSHLLCV